MTGKFIERGSVIRDIWGNSDTILLVFAGSAAEFALNRAVDWLFYTGKVPHDPIGRLFSTARFAQEIGFADEETARRALDRINTIHSTLERQRGQAIPMWAHRDVLYMLIDYSERAYRLLHRPLTPDEQEELYAGFLLIGNGLHITELPANYVAWQRDRVRHLAEHLVVSDYTSVLYAQYRRHLGAWRYDLLLQIQGLLVPQRVRSLLKLNPRPPLARTLWTYPLVNRLRMRRLTQRLLIPSRYLPAVRQLDRPARATAALV